MKTKTAKQKVYWAVSHKGIGVWQVFFSRKFAEQARSEGHNLCCEILKAHIIPITKKP